MKNYQLNELGTLFTEVPKVINGKPRPDVAITIGQPSAKQLAQARFNRSRLLELGSKIRELQQEADKIRSECPHDVCYDVKGWPYDERYCAGCDKGKGSI